MFDRKINLNSGLQTPNRKLSFKTQFDVCLMFIINLSLNELRIISKFHIILSKNENHKVI